MIKCTMLFEQQSNLAAISDRPTRIGGWSESYYADTDLANAKVNFHRLCQARASLLTRAARIIGQRYQLVGGGAQTEARTYVGSDTTDSDVPQMGLLCVAGAGSVPNVRRFTLRGLPDIRSVQGEFNPSNGYQQKLDVFFSLLANFKYKGKNLAAPTQVIAKITSGGLVSTTTTYSYAFGQQWQLMRVRNSDGQTISGIVTVAAEPGPGSLSFNAVAWNGGTVYEGEIRLVTDPVYTSYDPARINVSRVVVRKVGRPFSGYRGRRSSSRHVQRLPLAPA